jgi:methenyltetrahydromethanopterin cyclohydrolase
MVSVNRQALKLVEAMVARADELRIGVEEGPGGCTLIDAGIKHPGGFLAGKYVTEICLGGLGEAHLTTTTVGGQLLPAIEVVTDHPAVALLGSQFAGWRISVGKYFAMGSGPARALSLKPKDLYAKIGYRDESDKAVIVLETSAKPPKEAIDKICEGCGVAPSDLCVVLTPTSSLAGSVQISGRIVETGLHKLVEVGLDPKRVLHGAGRAPVAPVHPDSTKAMGRTNDMLLYGGTTYFLVDYEDEAVLQEIVAKAPSSASPSYGRPFYDTFKAAGFDFYKIDPGLFAPAQLVVTNIRTGKTLAAGEVNIGVVAESLGLPHH